VFFEIMKDSKHVITPIKHKHFLVLIGVVQGEAMQLKHGLVALSVMATLVLAGGNTAQAKSNETDTNEVIQAAIVAEQTKVITVAEGDTLADIAIKNNTSYVRLFNANDKIADPDVIHVGDAVRIPNDDEQLPDRYSQLSAEAKAQIVAQDAVGQATGRTGVAAAAPVRTAYRGSSAGNTYAYGWCTWYAKERRPDLPNNLGNGGSWTANAAAQGIATGSAPRAGAIAETTGHVAYVESVNGDGTMTISEMGWNYSPGVYNVRTISASGWRFIY
jgi:surface antigen